MKSESEIREALRAWVLNATKRKDIELTDQTPLIESRIITSIQVMDLLLQIERLRGRKITMDDLRAGVFKSIDVIYTSFFKAVPQ